MQTVDEITDFSTITYNDRLIMEIVKKDDEITRQAIKDYFKQKYPKENLRFKFLDEEIVDEIIKFGISEYLKKRNLVVDLNKEKTADELFEELGYKKVRDDERFIKYRKPHDNDYIVIDKATKDFIKNFDFEYWKAVNTQELQAINKKCQELGWIE